MRIYEELFVIKPDTPVEEVDAYVNQVTELITNGKGTIEKTDKWGIRKLAYRLDKYTEGIYVLIQFSAPSELVHEVERRMRVTDMVIKFITVRIDEKLKKIAKRKKKRDARAARKPAPPVAQPMVPMSPAEPSGVAHALPGLPGAPTPDAPEAAAPAAEVGAEAPAEVAAVEAAPVEAAAVVEETAAVKE